MKMLLHTCCADCALKFAESIKNDPIISEMVFFYYNPNIHPRAEYQARLKAIKQVAEEKKIKLVVPDWKPGDYFEKIVTSKKPVRCVACWNLRLKETAEYAKKHEFEVFASTLVTSQYQDNKKIKEIAKEMAKKHGLSFYVPKIICSDLKTSGFYKQFFCGCSYSLTERMEEKFGTNLQLK